MLICKNCRGSKILGYCQIPAEVRGEAHILGPKVEALMKKYGSDLRYGSDHQKLSRCSISLTQPELIPETFECGTCGAHGSMEMFMNVETCPNCRTPTEGVFFCFRFRVILCEVCRDRYSCADNCSETRCSFHPRR